MAEQYLLTWESLQVEFARPDTIHWCTVLLAEDESALLRRVHFSGEDARTWRSLLHLPFQCCEEFSHPLEGF